VYVFSTLYIRFVLRLHLDGAPDEARDGLLAVGERVLPSLGGFLVRFILLDLQVARFDVLVTDRLLTARARTAPSEAKCMFTTLSSVSR